ncbi:PLP-dependent transferase [Calocera cornea HHB12733]|uniref:PLP-dependent transferase n=1 Tax=Calocera cornea HHB12733 TaxID=1353952 RepID=A0A165EGP7_9BASI|nr:PLP-dependent transferase [Calocera cornea HHB12733]
MAVNGTSSKGPKLSRRGAEILATTGAGITAGKATLVDAYDAVRNPDGYINLNAAQNTLQQAELLAFLKSKFDVAQVDFTFGDDFSGSQRLLRALAGFLSKHFAQHKKIEPDDIMIGSGCGPLTDQLMLYLADPGDGVLLPVPYFVGYKSDLVVRNEIKPIPVPVKMEEYFSATTIPLFEETLKKAEADGTPVRAVILCNPHNPLGQCYPRETILEYARFCEKHDLHLVCDEIFAFSTFQSPDVPNAPPFVSALSLDLEAAGVNPARVHVLYGLSKDFNANGLRGGALISPANHDLLTAVRVTSAYMKISSATSVLWSLILEDDAFWSDFVAENQKRLAAAYRYATGWLKFQHIPFYPAFAGHFVSVNLRQFFPSKDSQENPISDADEATKDQALNQLLVRNKVLLGSSASFAFPERGWFRFCFSMKPESMAVALRRLEQAFDLAEWDGTETAH